MFGVKLHGVPVELQLWGLCWNVLLKTAMKRRQTAQEERMLEHNSFAGDVFLSTCLGEISRIVLHALNVDRKSVV